MSSIAEHKYSDTLPMLENSSDLKHETSSL